MLLRSCDWSQQAGNCKRLAAEYTVPQNFHFIRFILHETYRAIVGLLCEQSDRCDENMNADLRG